MGDFEWLGRAKRKKPDGLYELVVRKPGVGQATKAVADSVGLSASMILGNSREEGHSRIIVDKGTRSDAFVTLDDSAGDSAAAAIEFGHMRNGERIQGVAPLRKAIAQEMGGVD